MMAIFDKDRPGESVVSSKAQEGGLDELDFSDLQCGKTEDEFKEDIFPDNSDRGLSKKSCISDGARSRALDSLRSLTSKKLSIINSAFRPPTRSLFGSS